MLFETYQRFGAVSASGVADPAHARPAAARRPARPAARSRSRSPTASPAACSAVTTSASACWRARSRPPTRARRIAADLHDGIVQDLAGVAFGLAPLAAKAPSSEQKVLNASVERLRQGVRDLRTLLVEIHPPRLESAGLEAALDDLLSPLRAAGVETALEVEPTRDDALVYRVVREALRNAAEHAQARHVTVTVTPRGATIRDDGAASTRRSARGGARRATSASPCSRTSSPRPAAHSPCHPRPGRERP